MHYSLFTIHYSLFTIHYSLFIIDLGLTADGWIILERRCRSCRVGVRHRDKLYSSPRILAEIDSINSIQLNQHQSSYRVYTSGPASAARFVFDDIDDIRHGVAESDVVDATRRQRRHVPPSEL